MPLLPYLEQLAAGKNLSADEAQSAMQTILDGGASPAQIAGFLMALRVQGETVDELVGFARAMRRTALRVDLGLPGETIQAAFNDRVRSLRKGPFVGLATTGTAKLSRDRHAGVTSLRRLCSP